ncbi:DUF2341 domain-containing protein [Planctomycetales bacterium ZRK34]|nr:DUF2341 domain-containing protein [Planctomycetales bacterium ZRK34]
MRRNVLICGAVAVLSLGLSVQVQAGIYDSAWVNRQRLSVINAGGGSTLTDAPVMIRLTSDNFDFSVGNGDGSDLRFSTADGLSALSYEIEKWDDGNEAIVWVKAPTIDAASNNGYIRMYSGNVAASDAQNVNDVWSNGYAGVWHLNNTGTGAVETDSTSTGITGNVTGAGVTSSTGVIGDGRTFDSSSDRIEFSNAALNGDQDITVEFWMKGDAAAQPNTYTRPVSKNQGDLQPGFEYQRNNNTEDAALRIDSTGTNNQLKGMPAPLFDDQWHYVATAFGFNTGTNVVDGSSNTFSFNRDAGVLGNTNPLTLGRKATGGNQFAGQMDEVRFSNVQRSADWLNAQYRSQSNQLLSYAAVVNPNAAFHLSHEQTDATLDDTVNGYDATNTGVDFIAAPTPAASGFYLGDTTGFYVRNQNDHLDVSDAAYTGGDFTLIALVNRDTADLNQGHATIFATDRFRFQWRINRPGGVPELGSQQLNLDVKSAGGSTTNATGPQGNFLAGTWYFVALRYDASENLIEAFLEDSNGAIVNPELSINLGFTITDLSGMRIGADGLTGIGSFDTWWGQIDNTQLYNAALSDGELQSIFTSVAIPEPASLTLLGVCLAALTTKRARRR